MADILYMPDTDGDNSDEGVGSDIQNEDSSSGNQYDFLPPLQRLEKHVKSDNIFHRQLVGRLILETLPEVADSPDDVALVMGFALRVADDPDAPVRAELMEQVPHITMFCHEDRHRLHHVIPDHLLPLVVKFLSDTDNQVRKMSHAALLVMMEQGLIEQEAVERTVCPVVVHLTELEGQVDYHTGAIALMAKMAPLLGGSKTKELFVPHFAKLCSNQLFYVRKACASFIGDFCAVVGTQATEELLLSKYVALCGDEVWGVRKACAEVIMPVACKCTMESRRRVLAPAFDSLLADSSRWVRSSAFATLGPFISTFSPRCISDLAYNHLRELVVVDDDHNEFRLCTAKGGDGDVMVKFVDGSTAQPFNFNFRYNNFTEDNNSNNSSGTVEVSEQENTNPPNRRQSAIWSINAPVINAEEMPETEPSDADNKPNETGSESCPTEGENSEGDNCWSESESCKTKGESCQNEGETCQTEGEDCRTAGESIETKTAADSNVAEKPVADEDTEASDRIGVGGAGEPVASDDDVEAAIREAQLLAHQQNVHRASRELSDCGKQAADAKTEGATKSVEQTLKLSTGQRHIHVESFNTFQYWRVPIPELSVDISLDGGKATSVQVTAKVTHPATQQTYAAKLDVNMDIENDLDKLASQLELDGTLAGLVRTTASATVTDSPANNDRNFGAAPSDASAGLSFKRSIASTAESKVFSNVADWDMELEERRSPWTRGSAAKPTAAAAAAAEALASQDVVPPALLQHYVSMTTAALAQAVDTEIAHHCAFSFPAVVMTLGRDNWPLVRPTYQALATDFQWKVRRTVASGIHEVGLVLGLQLATHDLIPIFNDFIKDLDEVRIGALKHLASFLALLLPEERNTYLPRLQEFMLTDNEWNWRFREKLAEQLYLSVPLFEPFDARTYIMPLGYTLLLDKVSAVRHMALNLVKQLVQRVSVEAGLVRGVLTDLAQQFAHSKCWCRRQMFALLCARLVAENVLPDEDFARDVLPHLLDLSWDAVPNVRLAVARTLAAPIMENDYFLSDDCPHSELTYQVMRRLQNDVDQDVRVCALAVGTQRVHKYTPSNLRFPIPLA